MVRMTGIVLDLAPVIGVRCHQGDAFLCIIEGFPRFGLVCVTSQLKEGWRDLDTFQPSFWSDLSDRVYQLEVFQYC